MGECNILGRPDYDHFHRMFSDLLVREGFQNDMIFDWDVAHGNNPGRDVRPRNGPGKTWRGQRASYKHCTG